MAYDDLTTLGSMPGLGEEMLGYGSLNPADPYIKALLRRQMLAQQLAAKQPSQPMTHWLQPVAQIVNSGLGALREKEFDERIRDYSRQQSERADRAFQDILSRVLGGGQAAQEIAQPKAPTPSDGVPTPSAGAQEFIRRFAPEAQRVSQETGLDPRLPLAQAALETGWGAKAPGNNYFGIKGPGQSLATTEVVNGQRVPMQDTFRAYETPEASFSDYAKFVRENPRYAPVLQAQGLENQIAAMGKSGYATDPQYGQKLNMLARGIQMPEAGPTQVAQAPTGTMTDAGAPGIGGMNREQINRLRAMVLMNSALAADPRYARMAQGLGALAQSIPETKWQTAEIGGQVVAYDPANPQRRQVLGPATGHTPLPPAVATQKRELGAPYPAVAASPERHAQDMERGAASATRIQMTNDQRGEGTFSQERGKQLAGHVDEWQSARAKGSDMLISLANFERANKAFTTGAGAGARLTVGKWAQLAGLPESVLSAAGLDKNALASAEEMRSITSRMLVDMIGKGGFPAQNFSNADREELMRALSSVDNTPEGNARIIRIARSIAERQIEVGKAWADWRRQHGTTPSSAERFMEEKLPEITEMNVIASMDGGSPIRVNTIEDVAKLPPGTPFLTPDGRQGWAR